MPKWLPLMRTGTFTDRHGKTYKIEKQDLDRIASNYDGAGAPAHLVVGHPNAPKVPSFGIVEKLKTIGDKLFFLPQNVVPEFQALVAKGGFPNVSAGLRNGLSNLHHIAFLSGQLPAITGMEPIAEFSAENDIDVVSIDISDFVLTNKAEFSEGWLGWRLREIANMFRKYREYVIEKDGVESADKVLPSWDIDQIGAEPPQPLENSPQFSGQEGDKDMEFKLLYEQEKAKREQLEGQVAEFQAANTESVAKIATLTGEIETLKTTIADSVARATEVEFEAYVEKLIDKKILLPNLKEDTVAALVSLHKAEQSPEFSAPEDPTKTPLAMFKAQLEKGQFVPGSEHNARQTENPEFSEADVAAWGNKAAAYVAEQKKNGIVVSIQEAVQHVRNSK